MFKAIVFLMPKVFQNPARPYFSMPELYGQPWWAKKLLTNNYSI